MRKFRLLPIFLSLMMVSSFACPIYAEQTEKLISTNTEADTTYTASEVDELISTIDTENPDQASVAKAKEAYESLSMAEQLAVENYDTLLETEKALNMDSDSTNQDSEDTANQKNGDSYTIRFSSYMPQATLSIRFVTDEDGDGKMDAPNIIITSPTNEIYEIEEEESTLQTAECEIDILRADSYIQLNVSSASDGVWTFKTSNRVIFESSDYKGNEEPATFSPSTENTDSSEDIDMSNKATSSKGTNPLILVAFAGVVAVLFIFIKKMPTANKKTDKKTFRATNKTLSNSDEDKEDTSAEDEIRKIKEEWEKERQNGLYKDYEDPVKKQNEVDDDRLDQTVIEVADESDIDDLDDGFFTGARFKK